uniref:Prolamin_like domain-containing protein n=1 Tax=Macrostomum lignano TaxID=282301 RepID=A0A1I8JNX8_9PLAT
MIEDIFVQGGGDCPEATLQGIKLATGGCTAAPPSSTCSPTPARKIRNCLTQFLNSFNGKRVRWFFVLTGDCGDDENSVAFQCYQRISQASSGILIRIYEKSCIR